MQPATTPASPKETLRALRILFAALVMGVAFFTIIVVCLNLFGKLSLMNEGPQIKNIFLGSAVLIAAICLPATHYLYKKKLIVVKNFTGSLNDKLNLYRTPFIQYMAMCEGPALFSVIVYFLTADFRVLIVTALCLAAMMLKAPLTKKIIEELNLDWKEQQELE